MEKSLNLKEEQIRGLLRAAKLIEEDGIDAFVTVRKSYGDDVAVALLLYHLLNVKSCRNIVSAIKLIVNDEVKAFPAVKNLIEDETAFALITTHLRRKSGSMLSFPSDPEIDEKIVDLLRNEKII